jgi:hypothetical protein
MSKPNDTFLVVGAGSHAHRVAEAICATGGTVVGFATNDGFPIQHPASGAHEPILQLEQALQRFPDAAVVVAIGASDARRTIIESIRGLGRRLPPIVHPQATVSPRANIGESTVILAAGIVEWGAAVGAGTIIDVHAVVCHEARIGPMSHIQPGTIVGPRAEVPGGTTTEIGERILLAHA